MRAFVTFFFSRPDAPAWPSIRSIRKPASRTDAAHAVERGGVRRAERASEHVSARFALLREAGGFRRMDALVGSDADLHCDVHAEFGAPFQLSALTGQVRIAALAHDGFVIVERTLARDVGRMERVDLTTGAASTLYDFEGSVSSWSVRDDDWLFLAILRAGAGAEQTVDIMRFSLANPGAAPTRVLRRVGETYDQLTLLGLTDHALVFSVRELSLDAVVLMQVPRMASDGTATPVNGALTAAPQTIRYVGARGAGAERRRARLSRGVEREGLWISTALSALTAYRVGYFILQTLSSGLTGIPGIVTGYPDKPNAEAPGGTWTVPEMFTHLDTDGYTSTWPAYPTQIWHYNDFSEGQSGAPYWTNLSGGVRVCGIHWGFDPDYTPTNAASRWDSTLDTFVSTYGGIGR